MASVTILSDNGATSGSAGLKTSGGNDGKLLLQTTTTGGTATTAVTIDNSQNVGIGVTPSAWSATYKMEQVGIGAAFGGRTNTQQQAYMSANWFTDGSSNKYIANGYATQYQQDSGAHYWFTAGNNVSGSGATLSFTQAMTLDASGKWLLGRTSAQSGTASLANIQQAGGNLTSTTVTRANATGIYIDNGGSSTSNYGNGIWFDHGSLFAGIASSRVSTGNWGTDIRFYTHPDTTSNDGETYERARIDSSGNLLVGTTSVTTTGVGGATFVKSSLDRSILALGSTNTGSGIEIVWFYNPNGKVGRIETSSSATSYVTSSDYRLKDNVQPMTGALEKVAALKPCTYTWKVDGSEGQGFIAHELQAVVPDAVSGEKDAIDEDGSIKPQGIDTSFLVATLTAAIQEQQALITTLSERIAALEGA